MLTVTFRSLGHGKREHIACFDLGNSYANALAALDYAHKMRCTVVSSVEG